MGFSKYCFSALLFSDSIVPKIKYKTTAVGPFSDKLPHIEPSSNGKKIMAFEKPIKKCKTSWRPLVGGP